jgi:cation:H+ antiporter
MTITFFIILVGLVLLAAGAEGLVRGSVSVAFRMGMSPLVIGLTIVAFGTGSPELMVSIESAIRGSSELALGNVVGSNISNIALILGLSSLVRPIRVRAEIIKRDIPIMILVTSFFFILIRDWVIDRIEAILLIMGSIVYTYIAYLVARRNENLNIEEEFKDVVPNHPRKVWKDIIFIIAGLLTLLVGAKLLLSGVVAIATKMGINQVIIGLTVVAVGTSLPELATSVVAAIKDEGDIAIGNVVGSNILNVLCFLGIAAIIQPISAQNLRGLDLIVMLGSSVLILPLMRRGFVLNRWEGALLLIGYIIYIFTTLPKV